MLCRLLNNDISFLLIKFKNQLNANFWCGSGDFHSCFFPTETESRHGFSSCTRTWTPFGTPQIICQIKCKSEVNQRPTIIDSGTNFWGFGNSMTESLRCRTFREFLFDSLLILSLSGFKKYDTDLSKLGISSDRLIF